MDQLLTPLQVAEMLGISETTLKRMRLAGDGPPPVFLSARTIRYHPDRVREWLDTKQTNQPTERSKVQ